MSENEVQQPVEEDILSPISNEYEFPMDDWKSNKIDKLAEALAQAQGEMDGVTKTSTNPFYKSKYADINDCLEASLPHLSKYGLAITQGNEFSKTDGYYITTVLLHKSGQWLKSKIRIPLTNKKDAQEIGSACTYGRRYGLAAMVGLAQVDDDGNKTVNERSTK